MLGRSILILFVLMPIFSLSQDVNNFTPTVTQDNSSDNEDINFTTNYLKNADNFELIDWGQEANRKVKMFYKYISYISNVNLGDTTRREAAMLASDLFLDKAQVCDSILLDNKEQVVNYEVGDFLEQLIEFDKSNVSISHLSVSDRLPFNVDTATKTYEITESITFTILSDEINYNTDKTVAVHFIFVRNLIEDKVSPIVKLGDINFSK